MEHRNVYFHLVLLRIVIILPICSSELLTWNILIDICGMELKVVKLIYQISLKLLSEITGGNLNGDPEFIIKGFSPDPLSAKENEFCFVFSKKYLK